MESVELIRILAEFKELREDLAAYKKESQSSRKIHASYRSDDINELATALAKAQAEMNIAEINKMNSFFRSKYADFKSVVYAARPSLTKYGLAVTQDLLTYEDGSTMLHTVLLHSSGQWMESRMRIIPPKNDIQTMSSYITYMKRITYSALIGVTTGEEDDDGEIAVAESRETAAKGTALNTKYNPTEISPETISKDQLDELYYELSEYPDIAQMILEGFKLRALADMPKVKYMASITRIREIKNLRNGIK
jgi:ERF superfamily